MEKFIFCDTETTGLDYEVHGILTAYFVEVQLIKGRLKINYENELELSIKYDEDKFPKVTKTAIKINKIDLSTFVGTHTPSEAVRAIIELKEKISPTKHLKMGGQNIHFDIDFLKKMFKGVSQSFDDYFHHHTYDSMASAMNLKYAEVLDVKSVSLGELRNFFEIDMSDIEGEAHTAKWDVIACVRVLDEMNGMMRHIVGL